MRFFKWILLAAALITGCCGRDFPANGDLRPEKWLYPKPLSLDVTRAEISTSIQNKDLKQILKLVGRIRMAGDREVLSVSYYPPYQNSNVTVILRSHIVRIARIKSLKWEISTVAGYAL